MPGALNVPLDHIRRALPDIRRAAEHGDVLVVCASGARSENACRILADHRIPAATLSGGTTAWAADGHELHSARGTTRATWGDGTSGPLHRRNRRPARPPAGRPPPPGVPDPLGLSIAVGLVFSALTNTCGMAAILAKLPHNRPRPRRPRPHTGRAPRPLNSRGSASTRTGWRRFGAIRRRCPRPAVSRPCRNRTHNQRIKSPGRERVGSAAHAEASSARPSRSARTWPCMRRSLNGRRKNGQLC